LTLSARNFFSKLLFDETSAVQAGGRIQIGRPRDLDGMRCGTGTLPRELPPTPPEQPLAVEEPSVEQQKQAHYSPANLIRTQVVKMLIASEERGERGEEKGHCGKSRHEEG